MVDHVDTVEINHFYDDQGCHVFDQALYYDWNKWQGRNDLRDWRLIKDGRAALTEDEKKAVPPKEPQWIGSPMVPVKQPNGLYKAVWMDGYILREVVCNTIYESWTQYDPELAEREILPKEQRRGLSDPNRQTKKAIQAQMARFLEESIRAQNDD